MKNKIKYLFGFLLLMTNGFLYADSINIPEGATLEYRLSYFYPSSSNFRHLFHGGGTNYQLTGTIPIYPERCDYTHGVNVWGAIDYFSKSEHTDELGNRITIRIIPTTLGLKYFFPTIEGIIPVNFYAAGGMKFYYVHTHNNSDLVKKTIDKRGLGGVVEAGFTTVIHCHLLLDVFASYSFRTFGPPSNSDPSVKSVGLDVSGFNFGAGLGYIF